MDNDVGEILYELNEQKLAERVAVLESEWKDSKQDWADIKTKLDDLLHLKSKGMGALWLISLLFSSGILALVAEVISFFNHRPHL